MYYRVQLCFLFNQANLAICYEEAGVRKAIQNDSDVLAAVKFFATQSQASPTALVLRVDVEPIAKGAFFVLAWRGHFLLTFVWKIMQ